MHTLPDIVNNCTNQAHNISKTNATWCHSMWPAPEKPSTHQVPSPWGDQFDLEGLVGVWGYVRIRTSASGLRLYGRSAQGV
eukprot:9493249-Pyramimonas_sp.AAC.1